MGVALATVERRPSEVPRAFGEPLPQPGWSLQEAYEVTDEDPPVPGSGVPVENLAAVNVDDGSYLVTARADVDHGWDGQVYRFKLNDFTPEGLSRITVRWVGYGEATTGYPVRVELYNQLLSQWDVFEEEQTVALGSDIAVELDLVGSFGAYVGGDGTLWARVKAYNLELAAPTELQAWGVASNEVRLGWADNATSETGYVVQVRVEDAYTYTYTWETVATLPADSTAYTHYDRDNMFLDWDSNDVAYYRVYAVAGSAQSAFSNTANTYLVEKATRPTNGVIVVPGDADTIQEALNVAQMGDTVTVDDGTYAEALVIRTPGITLAGIPWPWYLKSSRAKVSVPNPCVGEYCAGVSIVTGSANPVTVRSLEITGGSGTLMSGVRYGGGVFVGSGSAATLAGLLLRYNALPDGGHGSAVALVSPHVVSLTNVVAMANMSPGAAVYVSGADHGVGFYRVTLAYNGPASGDLTEAVDPAAGIWVEGSGDNVYVSQSIVWGNGAGLTWPGLTPMPQVATDLASGGVFVNCSIGGSRIDVGSFTDESREYRGVTISDGPSCQGSVQDPLLVGNDDPHLRSGSPAKDAFPQVGSGNDYEGVPRPQGAKWDIGASEYRGATSRADESDALSMRPTARRRQPQHASLNTDSIQLVLEPAVPPSAPSNLRTVAVAEDRITLRFQDNATDEDGFTVHRRLGLAGIDQALSPIAAHPGIGDVVFTDYGADTPSGRLAPGTEYCYYVSAYRGSAGADSPQVCRATVYAAGTSPAAPGNVAASGISAGQIRLTWTDSSGDEDGFAIYRRRQGDGSDFAVVSPPAVANATSYVDSGGDTPEGILRSGATYCYRVAAYNEHGLSSAVPVDPDGVCVATPDETWVEVFEDGGGASESPSHDELGTPTGFQFQGEGDSVELETRLAELLGSLDAFNWQVFAVHLDTPPQGLTSLTLRWRGHGESQPNYPIRFSLYNYGTNSWDHQPVFSGGQVEGDVRPIAPNTNTVFTFNLTSAQLAASYAGTAAERPNTVLLWVRAKAYIPAPLAPVNLRAYPAAQPTTVYIAWDDRSSDETGFEVQRSPGAPAEQSWSTVGTASANSTSYTESVPVASIYSYRVRAMRGEIGSTYTGGSLAVVTPLYVPYLPSVVPEGSSSIRVRWQLNPGNGDRFPAPSYATQIYRAPGTNPAAQDWQLVGTATGGALTYLDSGLEPNTTYSYYLSFSVSDGGFTWPSESSVPVYTKTTQLSAPPAPEYLDAMPVSASQINLEWEDVGGELDYSLERQSPLNGLWQTVDSQIPADEASYGDVGLSPGTLYRYRIRARNAVGYSTYSNVPEATTFAAGGERWETIGALPSRNGEPQGIAVLASHGGYLYAASNDVERSGHMGWSHLNVWRSADGGYSWEWVGQTSQSVLGNLPVAMASFGSDLYLLTRSRLWSSPDGGISWVEKQPNQGAGYSSLDGAYSHLTVFQGRLYVLLANRSVFSYAPGGGDLRMTETYGADVRVMAQLDSQMLGGVAVPASPPAPLAREVYRSPDAATWTLAGTVPGEDGFGRCDRHDGLLGFGGRIYSGASNVNGYPCLWMSVDGGANWVRSGSAVNIWAALPTASGAYIATTAAYPQPVAARIDDGTGTVNVLATPGLGNNFRMWSLASHGGQSYAAAFAPAQAARILRLVSDG